MAVNWGDILYFNVWGIIKLMKNKFAETFYFVMETVGNLTESFLIRESLNNKMMRLGGIDPKIFYKGIKNLERRKIIYDDSDGFRLTRKGIRRVQDYKFQAIRVSDEKWDRKWRLVIFDIPENMKKKRSALRWKLRSLNFYMIQQSVHVLPYKCEEEISFICGYLKISQYVSLVIAEEIVGHDEQLKKHFGL